MYASDFEKFPDGKRFHARETSDGYQVYSHGIVFVCLCESTEAAKMVMNAMNYMADMEDSWPIELSRKTG